jgi:hypothetical protein
MREQRKRTTAASGLSEAGNPFSTGEDREEVVFGKNDSTIPRFRRISSVQTHQSPRDVTMREHEAVTERGSMSRSGPTAPASPKENFGRPARRLLLRLREPRSVGRRFDAFALRISCLKSQPIFAGIIEEQL